MEGSESFFNALKSKRETQNIEISEICEFTKIHPRYIEAFERGDFTVLPNVYIRLFLRSYANFIGSDSAKALKDYEFHTTGKITQSKKVVNKNAVPLPLVMPHPKTEMDPNRNISQKKIASGLGVIFVILLFLWWAGRITHEQTENIVANESKAEVAIKSVPNSENEVPTPESNLPELSPHSNTDQGDNRETEKQSEVLPDKLLE